MSVDSDSAKPSEGPLPRPSGSPDELARSLYDELHALARRHMAPERQDHTLQPTALVNEAYLKLSTAANFPDRDSFLAAAATAIRRVLVDHARTKGRLKRGSAHLRVPLEELEVAEPSQDTELLALDVALERLAAFDPLKARIVELRFFGGLTEAALAPLLGISPSTLKREWRVARAWLAAELDRANGR